MEKLWKIQENHGTTMENIGKSWNTYGKFRRNHGAKMGNIPMTDPQVNGRLMLTLFFFIDGKCGSINMAYMDPMGQENHGSIGGTQRKFMEQLHGKYMEVSSNGGIPKWMVDFYGKSHRSKWIRGGPHFRKLPCTKIMQPYMGRLWAIWEVSGSHGGTPKSSMFKGCSTNNPSSY